MSFKSYLKSKVKYTLGIASLAAILSQLIFPVLSLQASAARFNFLPGDGEMITGRNITQADTTWGNPITGTAPNEFRGMVYYHNGYEGIVAENTKIKVNIPATSTNKTIKITGSVSADNAETITSTVIDGNIIGNNGLVVSFDQDVNVEFIPGSVKWFPNANQFTNTDLALTPLPSGQTGDGIVSANGINLGNINGCWNYAGFVTFGFKTLVKEAPALSLVKSVKNDTNGEVAYVKTTNAEVGNSLTYKVEATNSGSVSMANAIVKDTLPAGVTFTPNTVLQYKNGATVPTLLTTAEEGQFFGAGLNIGTLPAGKNIKNTFVFQAKVDLSAKNSMINTALITAAGLSASDTAKVNIIAPNIVKSKSAYNITKTEPAVIAEAGNSIEYTLTTKNTGTAAVSNFVVEDDLSTVLNYSEIVSISDSGSIVNVSGAKTVRWAPVAINPGQTITRKFTVKIVNPLPTTPNELKLVNTYGNLVTITIKRPPVPPQMSVAKYVRDITTGESNFVKSNQAYAGDILEYRINFVNIGTVPADAIKIYDVLPANTQYVAGTTTISRNGGNEQTLPDGIVAGGIKLDTVAAGEAGYIKFRVITSTGIAKGETLTNNGYLVFSEKTISDSASTVIVAKGTVAAPVTSLPKTGPGSLPGASTFVFTFLMGIAFLYAKYKKNIFAEENLIYSNLVA